MFPPVRLLAVQNIYLEKQNLAEAPPIVVILSSDFVLRSTRIALSK